MRILGTAAVAICLAMLGCSTPFKKTTSSAQINPSTASRITVQSISNSSLGKLVGNNFSPAAVSINGEYMGEFSRNETTFSYEVSPGSVQLDFCMEGVIPRCLIRKITVDPNTHYFYEYDIEGKFMVIGNSYQRRIVLIKAIPYGMIASQVNPEKNQQQNITKTLEPPKNSAASLEIAKKKCIDLGFKVGTESFGNCVLKVAN